MNCERFQEILHDYVDDALSPPEKAAAQAHLGECSTCRGLVQDEWLVGQVLSGRLTEAVETVTLDAPARQSMANEVRKQLRNAPESRKGSLFPSWLRLAIPAAASLLLISALWFEHGLIGIGDHEPKPRTDSSPSPPRSGGEVVLRAHGQTNPDPSGLEIPIHVSWTAPRYIFRQEGAMVVDALTSDARVADATLLTKKQTNPNHYDH